MTDRYRLMMLLGMLLCLPPAQAGDSAVLTFRGAADASAAVALDDRTLAVADDETNALRLYDVTRPGLPRAEIDLSGVAVVDRDHPELDLEGAARAGDRVYWIGSHGRNKDGKQRVNRSCLFATDIEAALRGPTLVPVGRVYRKLVEDLLREPSLQVLGLERTVRLPAHFESQKQHRERLAPKRQGLNIEALAAGPEGLLYIGFRNPRPRSGPEKRAMALVVPLLNVDSVLLGNRFPLFGTPVLLDLQGLGLRSMEYLPQRSEYLLVAGDHDGRTSGFVLYRWSGQPGAAPRPLRRFEAPQYDFNIEALVSFADPQRVLLLSDDGARRVRVNGVESINKELPDLRQRSFRGQWIVVNGPAAGAVARTALRVGL
jgi:hypothetical protein